MGFAVTMHIFGAAAGSKSRVQQAGKVKFNQPSVNFWRNRCHPHAPLNTLKCFAVAV
jgi:hypothetical protein